jgi:hypothetical protein
MILRHRSFVGRVGTSKLIPALHVGPQLIGVSTVVAHGGRTCPVVRRLHRVQARDHGAVIPSSASRCFARRRLQSNPSSARWSRMSIVWAGQATRRLPVVPKMHSQLRSIAATNSSCSIIVPFHVTLVTAFPSTTCAQRHAARGQCHEHTSCTRHNFERVSAACVVFLLPLSLQGAMMVAADDSAAASPARPGLTPPEASRFLLARN